MQCITLEERTDDPTAPGSTAAGVLSREYADDVALFRRFLMERPSRCGPVAYLNERHLFLSTAASHVVVETTRDVMWAVARAAICKRSEEQCLTVIDGRYLGVRAAPIIERGRVVGAEVRFFPTDSFEQPSPLSVGWSRLTEAEREIAEHVASGLSNREIAARTYRSRHTVDYHLRHVYQKLGISSRVDLTRLIVQRQRGVAGDVLHRRPAADRT